MRLSRFFGLFGLADIFGASFCFDLRGPLGFYGATRVRILCLGVLRSGGIGGIKIKVPSCTVLVLELTWRKSYFQIRLIYTSVAPDIPEITGM